MAAVLCPEVVGRSAEREWLLRLVGDAAERRGRAAALVGEAGLGKSRLAREAVALARAAGAAVAVGRCVEGPVAATLRPLREATTGLVRAARTPDVPLLAPYRAALGLLAPDLLPPSAPPAPAEPDPVHLGEGLLRLLAVHAAGRGALLVVEDAHDADPVTLAVLEYLAESLSSGGLEVCVLVTLRPDPSPGRDLVEALARRRSLDSTVLSPLEPQQMRRLVRLCAPDLPEAAVHVVVERSGGVPFLAEELLTAAADRSGAVDPARVAQAVPLSLLDAVRRRATALGPDALQLLQIAAVLGRSAPPELLAAATARTIEQLAAPLQAARNAHLLDADAGCTFRHALTRDAVLASVLPAERERTAQRLLPLAEHAGLEPAVLAQLAETARDGVAAARAWLAVADEALRQGLPDGADRALSRAEEQARAARDTELHRTVLLRRLAALALGGHALSVLALADQLLASAELDDDCRAEVHLHAARAALDAGQYQRAGAALRARGRDDANGLSLAGLVALAEGRLQEAEQQAVAVIGFPDPPAAALCEAWEVLGRVRRSRDLPGAKAAFAAAHGAATAAGLALWEVRALHELGTVEMFLTGRFDRLLEAHDAATALGALSTAAVLDVQIGSCLALALDVDGSLARTGAADALAQRTGARPIQAAAAVVAAQAHSYAGRADEAARCAVRATSLSADDPETRAILAGLVDGLGGLLAEDRRRARRGFAKMAALQEAAPKLPPTPALGLRVLLASIEDAPWWARASAEVEAAGATTVPYNALLLGFAEAVAHGRDGDVARADQVMRRAEGALGETDPGPAVQHLAHLGRRLVAEAALRDGWGSPVDWLRAATADLDDGAPAVADACRGLLRAAGSRAPRRTRETRRPLAVRAAGITEREYEVLLLVTGGATNRQVAERLHLSTRTVDTHVARLLTKTRCTGRVELAGWVHGAGPDVGSAGSQRR